MAAEVETMFSAREVPWHGLGTVTDDVQTAKEALVVAGLDWQVTMEDMFVRHIETGPSIDDPVEVTEIDVPDSWAVMRDSDQAILGTVGGRYKPVQNHRAFEFFDSVVGSGEAKYETAGSLRGGRLVFLTAKIPKEILVLGEDAIDLYLVMTNSHDGTSSFRADVTPIRVVCMNTLRLALKATKSSWRLRHTDSIDGKLAQARDALSLTFAYGEKFEREMNDLASQVMTKDLFSSLIRRAFPNDGDEPYSEQQLAMMGMLENSPTIPDSLRLTKYGALNAVTEYFDWGRSIRKSKSKSLAEQRTEAAWFGTVKAKQQFADLLSV